MYDLMVDGYRDIKRFVEIRKVGRDPLSGILDGSNRLFFTTYSPLMYGADMTLYDGDGTVSSGSYFVDHETGEVYVDAAPSSQLMATYFLCEYPQSRMTRFLMQAFHDMESRLHRGWRLSSGSVEYESATEDSDHIYIVDKGSNADPVAGQLSFSTSWVQFGFYLANLEYAIAMSKMNEAAGGFLWREDRGITVDKSRVASGRALSLQFIEERLKRYTMAASDEYYNGTQYGSYQQSPVTEHYAYDYEWQTASKAYGYRSSIR